MRTVISTFALLLCGCATTGAVGFVSDERLTFDRTRYANDAAVVLHREDRTKLVNDNRGWSEWSRHEVIAVLAEGGLDRAEVKIAMRKRWALKAFGARLIKPGGETVVFGPDMLLSDLGGKREQDTNSYHFRFPDAGVGDVLEYRYVIEAPFVLWWGEQETLGTFPVRHYEFHLTASPSLLVETIEVNSTEPIKTTMASDGSRTMSFELHELPARSGGDLNPHWTYTEPRWAWRLVGWKDRSIRTDALRDWNDVVQSDGVVYFTAGKVQEGFAPGVDLKGCSDVTCLATRAVEAVQRHTVSDNVGWRRAEKLSQAWASGRAGNVERALMVKALLDQQKLDTWLAFGTGRLRLQPLPTFPNSSQFNRLFVYLPAQRDLKAPLVIDVSCEGCAPGTLAPAWALEPIYVFKTTETLGRPATTGRWERPNVKSQESGLRVQHRARLHPNGNVTSRYTLEARGDDAEEFAGKHRVEQGKTEKLKDREESRAEEGSRMGDVTEVEWNACDYRACGFIADVKYAVEATRDGDRWLVPTTFLRTMWESRFLSTERTTDVHFMYPSRFEEIAELEVPEGLKLQFVPPPQRAKVNNFQVEVVFEPIANGVRVTRRLSHDISVFPQRDYAALREAFDRFKKGRREVLVFAP